MLESDSIHEMIMRDIILSTDFYFNNTAYHYTSSEGLLGIIRTGGKAKRWFIRFDGLNDKHERLDVYKVLAQYADIKYKQGRISEEFKKILCGIAEQKGKMPVFFFVYRRKDFFSRYRWKRYKNQ